MAELAQSEVPSNHYLKRKIHSLLGVVPLGIYIVEHILSLLFAYAGPESYNAYVAFMGKIPGVVFIEATVIWLPLAIHAIYGVFISLEAQNNVGRYSYVRNWYFYLQRITGFILFVFISFHLWTLRIAKSLYGLEISYETVASQLANPLTAIFYVVGVLSVAFHLANGMWLFCITWGITVGPRSQRISQYIWSVLFVLLSVVGVGAVFVFRA